MDPLDKITWFPGAIVNVIPQTIDAPDIIKIVVTRDGVQISPLVNELKPAIHQTRFGTNVTLHSGGVVFSSGPDGKVPLATTSRAFQSSTGACRRSNRA